MAVSLQKPFNVADDYHALVFVIQQLLNQLSTVTLVKVVKCTNSGGVSPFGFVDVIPLVNQITGDNSTVPHGTLYRLPYFRLQGGTNAVILDPQPDDIGLAAFASRDISSVKADPAAAVANANAGKGGAPPGSARQFDMADGVYFGGFLNGTPQQYVVFSGAGVRVVSPTQITLEAPLVVLDADVQITGDTTSDGGATFTDDVTAQGTSLHTHTHNGVTPGGGNSGPPV